MLVNLVRNRDDIPFLAETRNEAQLVFREHLACRVGRRVDDDGARLEVLVIRVVVLLQRFEARQRLDLGLRGVIDAAVQIAVGMGGF